MNFSSDPFVTLGLQQTASLEDVKRAYRRLAMRWHPDRNPSAAAENEFRRVRAAYELILDPQRYTQWQNDRTSASTTARDEPSEPATADDDVTQILILTLEEAARGCLSSIDLSRSSRCAPCHGTGRVQRTHSIPCAQCNGIGRLRGDSRGTHLCEGCGGRGYLRETDCAECSGSGWRKTLRTLSVKVPPGIVHGERLRLARQARNGTEDDNTIGDLYLEIRLAEHALFKLKERDLHCTVPVSIFRLLSGGQIDVPTLNGNAALDLLPYPAHGPNYRLYAQGFPKKNGQGAGDLIIHLQPVYPSHFGAKDRALLERLEASLAGDHETRAPELAAWAEQLREQQNL